MVLVHGVEHEAKRFVCRSHIPCATVEYLARCKLYSAVRVFRTATTGRVWRELLLYPISSVDAIDEVIDMALDEESYLYLL